MSDGLTPAQQRVLAALGASPLAADFYFSGGTALASQYLHHRRSLDLDFFSRQRVDPKQVVRLLNTVADGEILSRRIQHRYDFTVPVVGERLRVEFVHYDFDRVEVSGQTVHGVQVDSLRDLLANKLSCVVERIEPKDFVDIYFLLQRPELTLEQGVRDCQTKFGWPSLPFLLQASFLRGARLEGWPPTTPALDTAALSTFLRKLAEGLIELDGEGFKPR